MQGKLPTPSRLPARSVRGRAPPALAHSPPVRGMSGRGWLVGTGGGVLFYTSHFKGGCCPLCIPHGGEVSPAGSVGVGKAPLALNASPAPPPTRRGFGLGCRLGRSWTVPTGHQDPSRQARRCHRKAMTEGVMPGRSSGGDKIPAGGAQRNFPVPRGHAPHPLPPPVVTISAGKGLAATGGGVLFYTSHFKGACLTQVSFLYS